MIKHEAESNGASGWGDLEANPRCSSNVGEDSDIWQLPDSARKYAQFCQAQWYQTVIDTLIDHLPIDPNDQILDLGSGTGSGTCRVSEYLKAPGFVLGIDSSVIQVDYASDHGPVNQLVSFMKALIEEIPHLLPNKCDGVVAFNSIHLLGELPRVFSLVAEALKPGGYFGFCTGYATGAMEISQSLAVGRVLAKVTNDAVQRDLLDSASQGVGIKSGASAIRVKHLNSQLVAAGFAAVEMKWQKVDLPVESVAQFLTLPGMNSLPKEIPSGAQYQMILEELKRNSIEVLQRKWLHVVTVKGAG